MLLAYKVVICGVNLYDFSLLEPDTGRFSQFSSLSFSEPFTWLAFAGLLSSSVGQEVIVTNKLFKANNFSFGGKKYHSPSPPSTERHLKKS